MVAGSILPVTIYKNKLYFLFGKENEFADTPGFSDFGGRVEGKETPYETALREGSEELTGFLGGEEELKELIQNNGGVYQVTHKTYHIHMFFIEYDENLPKYYNQNHRFLWNRMNKKQLEKTRLFEKEEIQWFSLSEMKTRKSEFLNFYQLIVYTLIKDSNNIEDFDKKGFMLIKGNDKTNDKGNKNVSSRFTRKRGGQ